MALPIYRFLLLSIVPSFIGAVLVHKVNSSCFHVEQKYHVFDMPCTSCHINMFMDCPNGTEKITEMNGASGCTYEQSLGPGPNVTKDGCYHTCRQEVNVTSCCPGYWGSYCDGKLIWKKLVTSIFFSPHILFKSFLFQFS